jgi:biotin transporter BioY
LGGLGALGAALQSLRDPLFHYSIGFGFGFPLALAAAAAICVGALFERTRRQQVGWTKLGVVLIIGLGALYGVGLILLFTISVPV